MLTRGDVQHLLPERELLGSLELQQHNKRNHKQERMSNDLAEFIPPSSLLGNIPLLSVKCRDISQLICTDRVQDQLLLLQVLFLASVFAFHREGL